VAKKRADFVLCALTSSNIDRFSNFFHCQNQKAIDNNTVTKDPTTPQLKCVAAGYMYHDVRVKCLKCNNWTRRLL